MPPRRANKRNRPSQVSQPGRSNQLSQGFSAPLVTIRPSNKKYEWTSPRPDMRTAPDDFEASWEHDLEQNFDFLSGFPGNIIAWLNPRVVQVLSEDPVNVVDVQQSPIRAICTWQRELAKAVLAEPDFEKTWTELDDARRREVVLEGIVRAMGLTESTEGDRQWAPESTLKNLTADGGKEYLRILKCLTPQNPDEPLVEPRKVPHPTMDHLFTLSPREQGDPGCQAVVLVYTMRRLFILTAIIYNIFLALHNRPALEEPESQNVLVPVPQPYHNFICSPALKRQLDLLKGDGSYDYFIAHPEPRAAEGVRILPDPSEPSNNATRFFPSPDKFLFLIQRNRALRNGDAAAVKCMYAVLAKHLDAWGVSRAQFAAQLAEEYGVTIPEELVHADADAVDNAKIEFMHATTSPTRSEMTAAMQGMSSQRDAVE